MRAYGSENNVRKCIELGKAVLLKMWILGGIRIKMLMKFQEDLKKTNLQTGVERWRAVLMIGGGGMGN